MQSPTTCPTRFLIMCIASLLCTGQAAAATAYDEKNHDDGSLAYKIRLDKDGQRHGRYTMYHPSGRASRKGKKAETGTYVAGKRHGPRQRFDEKGKLANEDYWMNGRLTHPRSTQAIDAHLALLRKQADEQVASLGTLRHKSAPSASVLASTLAQLNGYRWLCGLSDDVQMADNDIYYAQCGADLLARINKLTHTPKNPGMPEQAFKDAYAGTSKSNIFNGRSGADAVDGYMDDSDTSNRQHLGHRRWILWPALATTGTGQAGRYSCLFVISKGKKRAPVADIPFPPRGFCPMDRFGAHYVWSFSVNPAAYNIDKTKAALQIYPFDLKSGKRASKPLSIEYKNFASGDSHRPPAICALPENLPLRKGASFEVVVEGARLKSAPDQEVSYIVTFY